MAKREGLNFYTRRRRKRINTGIIGEVFSWIFGIGLAIFLAAVLNYYIGMSISVVGSSMEPTLYGGQRIMINRIDYVFSKPERGDVIVFLPNGNKNSHYYVRRVVAVPGDTVLIEDGNLYVNGEKSDLIDARIDYEGIAASEITLGSGEYFCIGDNPESSEDSRSADIGVILTDYIEGKAWFALGCDEKSMGFIK